MDRALGLQRILSDASKHAITRSTAAGMLGCMLDPEPLPWNDVFASGLNYRACDSAMTGGLNRAPAILLLP